MIAIQRVQERAPGLSGFDEAAICEAAEGTLDAGLRPRADETCDVSTGERLRRSCEYSNCLELRIIGDHAVGG